MVRSVLQKLNPINTFFYKCLFLLSVLCFSFLSQGNAKSSFSVPSVGESEHIGYRFSSHLADAESFIQDREESAISGKWESDRFVFSGFDASSEIRLVSTTDETKKAVGIRFNPLRGLHRFLRFEHVPTGKNLLFSYQISPEVATEELDYVNIEIWIGKHLLENLRIPTNEPSQTKRIPLEIASFLNRSFVVTFEIYTNSSFPISFVFNAEVQ